MNGVHAQSIRSYDFVSCSHTRLLSQADNGYFCVHVFYMRAKQLLSTAVTCLTHDNIGNLISIPQLAALEGCLVGL